MASTSSQQNVMQPQPDPVEAAAPASLPLAKVTASDEEEVNLDVLAPAGGELTGSGAAAAAPGQALLNGHAAVPAAGVISMLVASKPVMQSLRTTNRRKPHKGSKPALLYIKKTDAELLKGFATSKQRDVDGVNMYWHKLYRAAHKEHPRHREVVAELRRVALRVDQPLPTGAGSPDHEAVFCWDCWIHDGQEAVEEGVSVTVCKHCEHPVCAACALRYHNVRLDQLGRRDDFECNECRTKTVLVSHKHGSKPKELMCLSYRCGLRPYGEPYSLVQPPEFRTAKKGPHRDMQLLHGEWHPGCTFRNLKESTDDIKPKGEKEERPASDAGAANGRPTVSSDRLKRKAAKMAEAAEEARVAEDVKRPRPGGQAAAGGARARSRPRSSDSDSDSGMQPRTRRAMPAAANGAVRNGKAPPPVEAAKPVRQGPSAARLRDMAAALEARAATLSQQVAALREDASELRRQAKILQEARLF